MNYVKKNRIFYDLRNYKTMFKSNLLSEIVFASNFNIRCLLTYIDKNIFKQT